VDAVAAVDPPVDLQLRLEIDETPISDHNRFWNADVSALLAADAPSGVLRQYSTYHRPIDLPAEVSIAKCTEVTRAHLAALLRFNTRAHTTPSLLLGDEDLTLKLRVQGTDVDYDPSFHRLWPGSELSAQLFVHSLGATFTDTLGITLTVNRGSESRLVHEQRDYETLPTGARIALFDAVPILPTDGGVHTLIARIQYLDASGAPVEQTAAVDFRVEVQEGLQITVQPNPVRGGLESATLAYALNRPGTIALEVFNLEGAGGTVGLQRLVNEKGNADILMQMGLGVVGAVYTNKSKATLEDTVPVAKLIEESEAIVVPKGSPYTTLDQLVAAWKANPGRVPVGGASNPGGPDHLTPMLLAKAVGVTPKDINYVAYDGGGELLTGVLGRKVAFAATVSDAVTPPSYSMVTTWWSTASLSLAYTHRPYGPSRSAASTASTVGVSVTALSGQRSRSGLPRYDR